jgi:methylmalonyl-CoA epimerase
VVDGATGPGLDRIDHVAVAVHDIRASLPYYTDILGLPVVADERAEDPGVRLVYLDAGNTYLQLVQPIRPGPVSGFLAERGEGLHHMCFAVQRLEHSLAALPGERDAAIFRGGRGRRACFLTGTANGALVELTEHRPTP